MFVKKAVLQICSKFTGENSCESVISIKLLHNFTEITLLHVLLCICCIFAAHSIWRMPVGDCFWISNVIKLVKMILKSQWYFAYLNNPLLLKLFFNNWCNHLIFMYDICNCWEWIAVYNYMKKTYIYIFKFIWKPFCLQK